MGPSAARSECWPALFTLELACRYLSLDSARFLALTERHHIHPVEVGDADARWRRKDLDRLVSSLRDALPVLTNAARPNLIALDSATVNQLANLIAARLNQSTVGPELLSVRDAGSRLGLSRSTVYKMIEKGTLTVRRIGGRTLITRDSIASLIGMPQTNTVADV